VVYPEHENNFLARAGDVADIGVGTLEVTVVPADRGRGRGSSSPRRSSGGRPLGRLWLVTHHILLKRSIDATRSRLRSRTLDVTRSPRRARQGLHIMRRPTLHVVRRPTFNARPAFHTATVPRSRSSSMVNSGMCASPRAFFALVGLSPRADA